MTQFSIILHLTHKNLSSFPDTLDSILNQEKRFLDMTIISELPNVEFDIRTLNTKVIEASNNINYSEIVNKCLGKYILMVNNKNSEVTFDNDFSAKLEKEPEVASGNNILVFENQQELSLIKKDYIIENYDIFIERSRQTLSIITSNSIHLKSLT